MDEKENGLETQSEQEAIDVFYAWFGTRKLDFMSSRDTKPYVWKVEPTQEEAEQAKKIMERIDDLEKKYVDQGISGGIAQSMAFLNDPDAGPMFAILARKNIEIAEREGVWSFDVRRDLNDDEKARVTLINPILKSVIKKVLGGEEITVEDYDSKQYPQLAETDIKLESDIANKVWHSVIQHFSRGYIPQMMMPQVLSLPREEQEKFINVYEEEVFRLDGFQGSGFTEKLAEMYPTKE